MIIKRLQKLIVLLFGSVSVLAITWLALIPEKPKRLFDIDNPEYTYVVMPMDEHGSYWINGFKEGEDFLVLISSKPSNINLESYVGKPMKIKGYFSWNNRGAGVSITHITLI